MFLEVTRNSQLMLNMSHVVAIEWKPGERVIKMLMLFGATPFKLELTFDDAGLAEKAYERIRKAIVQNIKMLTLNAETRKEMIKHEN